MLVKLFGLAGSCNDFGQPYVAHERAIATCRKMAEGLDLLCRAYNSNPSHPGVVNLLAHYCLMQGDYAKVRFLVQ